MGRRWAPDSIPDSNVVPTDTYRLRIDALGEIEGGTKGGENAKLPAGCVMYQGDFVIVEPIGHAGMRLNDKFVIGTANDPEARDPKTWDTSIGAKNLKRLLMSARVTITEDLDETCRNAVGNEVMAFVTTRAGDRGGEFNDVKRYYKLGERQAGTGANPPPAGRPAASAPSSGNGQTTMPSPTVPAAPAVPRRAETPTGGAAASPAAGAKVVKAKKVPTVQCPTCQEEVARDQFAAHMDAHDVGDEAEA